MKDIAPAWNESAGLVAQIGSYASGCNCATTRSREGAQSLMRLRWICHATSTYRFAPLRRNPRYVPDWVRYRRRASHRIAARWGLGALVDSQLDARQVSPVWSIAASSPVTVVRDETHPQRERVAVADIFSLWRLAGRKSLFEEGGGAAACRSLRPAGRATATRRSSRRWRSVRLPNPGGRR